MPRFGLDEGQAEAIVAFLLHSGSPDTPQDTYRVHFTRGASASPTVFEKECGGCHRFLGPAGPGRHRGRGAQPLRPLHAVLPADRPRRARLDREGPRRLAAQPARASRAHTTMPPVALGEDDLRKVTAELGGR